jgi:hypothetical protein
MTTLLDIRDLEARLHSHLLEWDDIPLQNELMFLLDDLQLIHNELDKAGIPSSTINGINMTLLERVRYLVSSIRSTSEYASPTDFYGQCISTEPKQLALFP